MKGICHLCDNSKERAESHVIPSFVYKWIKKSSGSGYLRAGLNPNRRVQDGNKYYWLCGDCEGLFSKWENRFAKELFHPMVKGEVGKVSYDDWLLKFCVSVSWRVLHLYLVEHNLKHYSDQMKDNAKQTHQIWREFLIGARPHPDYCEQHFLPFGVIQNHTIDEMPTNINRYILRSVDFDAVAGERSAFIYSKLERFVIIGFIKAPNSRQWGGTKVHVKHGVVGPRNYEIPIEFNNYFMGKARGTSVAYAAISRKQNKKIEKAFRENIDDNLNSEDVRLFGGMALKKPGKYK